MTVPTLLQQRCIASRPSPPALPAPDAAASKIQPEAQQHLVRSGAQLRRQWPGPLCFICKRLQ